MRLNITFFSLFICVIYFILPFKCEGKLDFAKYGLGNIRETKQLALKVQQDIDSIYRTSVFFQVKESQYGMPITKININKTADFYILLSLVLFLGVIRFVDPKYLIELWTAYFNTNLSGKSLRDKIEQSNVSNALMNLFFVLCFGCYVYYIVKSTMPSYSIGPKTPLLILLITGGVVFVYVVKYIVIRFTGWAFDIKGVTDTYLFNVFLVNKILAIGLLPFILVMAFHNPAWSSVALVLSAVVVITLFISRYVKSWQVLGSFFQYSKFHFFTYLCASEIMPLAILMKFLISKWL